MLRLSTTLKRAIRFAEKSLLNPVLVRGKIKYFCIGQNKTGTTSIKVAFRELGYAVGDQDRAERLLHAYRDGDWDKIISYCRSAQVFQDFPFSYPETYKHVDRAFPGSKFILSVRDSPEQWYNSLVQFHSRLWGNGEIPTREQLQAALYKWEGRPLEALMLRGVPEEDPYNKEILMNTYVAHNREVMEYFSSRPDDLLVLNLSDPRAYVRFCTFLGCHPVRESFPWKNKTSEKPVRRS